MSAARTALVVDASVALKWLVDEPGTDAAFALREWELYAPPLLRIEAANVLRTLAARGGATPEQAAGLFGLLQTAPVAIVDQDDVLEAEALALALDLRHPVYDCIYLALAERLDLTLVTADARFLRALEGGRFASRAMALENFSAQGGAGTR
jgi:predicted nucleic acid-binding protein